VADLAGLSDAGDDDFAAIAEAFDDGLDGPGEIFVETGACLAQAVDLDVEDSFR
jgi:hypothetical protein